jgi:2',3'-cyclic-nucleotide 2'-phosphodiesterase (5'-nucleotidase family)
VSIFDKESQSFQPLDMEKKYSVVTKAYLVKGKDGYDSFVHAPVKIEEELCPGTSCSMFDVLPPVRKKSNQCSLHLEPPQRYP